MLNSGTDRKLATTKAFMLRRHGDFTGGIDASFDDLMVAEEESRKRRVSLMQSIMH